ncbi:MAG: hypothetical protein JNM27_09780 [Leptospirales bacterium]|nr:hypothetical protein [Leptospirales bacterium]
MKTEKQNEVKSMAWLVVLSGLLTLITAVGMSLYGGGMKPRPGSQFQNPIVEFELALSAQEVFDVLLDPGSAEGKTLRAQMDRVNYADYVFMLCYSAFNACMFLFLGALNRARSRPFFASNRFMNLGLALAIVMLLGDAIENVQLLKLTNYQTLQEIPGSLLNLLIVFTRIKWVALFGSAILLGMAYAAYLGRSAGVVVTFLYCIGGAMGLVSMAVPMARPLAEVGTSLMAIGWIVTLVHAAIGAWRK